jgi:hypothetical protein
VLFGGQATESHFENMGTDNPLFLVSLTLYIAPCNLKRKEINPSYVCGGMIPDNEYKAI